MFTLRIIIKRDSFSSRTKCKFVTENYNSKNSLRSILDDGDVSALCECIQVEKYLDDNPMSLSNWTNGMNRGDRVRRFTTSKLLMDAFESFVWSDYTFGPRHPFWPLNFVVICEFAWMTKNFWKDYWIIFHCINAILSHLISFNAMSWINSVWLNLTCARLIVSTLIFFFFGNNFNRWI